MAELKVQNQQAIKESTKVKEDQDAFVDKLAKLEVMVAELRNR